MRVVNNPKGRFRIIPKQQQSTPEASQQQTSYEVGDLRWSARPDLEGKGWLRCDGRQLPAEKYPKLYAAVGKTYGGTEDNLFFNLPDPRDKVLGIAGDKHATGDAVGEETHRLTVAELPSHTHTGTTNHAGTHNHGGRTGEAGSTPMSTTVSTATGGAVVSGMGSHRHTLDNDGDHAHTFTTGPSGSGNPHNVMQPTLFIGHIYIYTTD